MSALPMGTSVEYAKKIQRALNEKVKLHLVVDGQFGPASIAALQQFQKNSGINPSGIYDTGTETLLEPFMLAKYLNVTDFSRAANVLQCETAAIKAVTQTEANGYGFQDDGKLVILFERHKFYKNLLLGGMSQADVNKLVATSPDIVNPTPGGYTKGNEYDRLNKAIVINGHAALLSASYGLFQIMGFNFATCGFKDVESFVASMAKSEGNQLDAFCQFIKSNANLLSAIRLRDWPKFALNYNGSNYGINHYDDKLRGYYATEKAKE